MPSTSRPSIGAWPVSGPSPIGRLSPNIVGALFMLASACVLTVQAAVVKEVSATVPIAVLLFVRMALILTVALAMAMARGGVATLRTRRPLGHLARAAFGFAMMAGSFYGITVLPLADATALSFTRPIWSMLTSYVAFGEVVGWLGGLATLAGFGGVLVIVEPQSGIHHGMIVALVAAASSSMALVVMKRLTSTEPVHRILFYFALFSTAVLAVPAALTWRTPDAGEFGWLLVMALCGAAGQTCATLAVRAGDVSVVTPIDFVRVPLAAGVGFAVFDESPDIWTFVGSAIIFASTVTILNARRRRRVVPQDAVILARTSPGEAQ